MVTADYASPSRKGVTLTAEIYDQGSVKGAFGRLSRYLSNLKDPSGAGAGLPEALANRGIFGGSDLIFQEGKYLVRLSVMDESPSASADSMKTLGRELLPPMAAAIAEMIPGDMGPPPELGHFPAEGKIAGFESWEPTEVAGLEGLGGGFAATYSQGSIQWQLLFTEELENPETVHALIEARGEKPVPVGDGRIVVLEPLGKRVVGFAYRPDGWTEAHSARARNLLESLVRELKGSDD